MKRTFLWLLTTLSLAAAPDAFVVAPYLQNPAQDSMTVLWVARGPGSGRVRCWEGGQLVWQREAGGHLPARTLSYSPWERENFEVPHPGYQREVRIAGLKAGHAYRYEVEQDGQRWEGEFHTAPSSTQSVHFIAYADSETEPESSGKAVNWENPKEPASKRPYLVDQTTGYAANLEVIQQRKPDFVVIAGDIVETGGEQRDWDEFWKHNRQLAGSIPIVGVIGNHEYYGGPNDGHYDEDSSERAVDKYLTYFRAPSNGRREARERGRYFRMDYGPICLIAIDGCNGLPHKSGSDTNLYLGSQRRPQGDFNPGSLQYQWLEQQLRDAQRRCQFTFVAFHHCPYSSGVHALEPGFDVPHQDLQSGRPMQVLTPLFGRYGVDVLLNGHDEMMERSEVDTLEVLPDGQMRPYKLQVYDVGIGGDGLRGPELRNPLGKFLAHLDSPEVWQNGVLQDGGKHYGHLEVEVAPVAGKWRATLTPVYVFPVLDSSGRVLRFERRVYADTVVLERKSPGR